MKKTRTKKSPRQIEKTLRERIKWLNEDLENVKADREKFRNDAVSNLKYAIDVHGKGHNLCANGVIERLARQLNGKQKWYW